MKRMNNDCLHTKLYAHDEKGEAQLGDTVHLNIVFHDDVTIEQQDAVFDALNELFKACGGKAGLMVDDLRVGDLVRHRGRVFRVVSVAGLNLVIDGIDGTEQGLQARTTAVVKLSALEQLALAGDES